MKLIAWLVTLPFLALVVAMAVVNRDPVTLDAWPFPYAIEGVPISVLILSAVGFGVVWGGVGAWFSAGGSRRAARAHLRRAEAAERELAVIRDRVQRQEADLQRMKKSESGSASQLPAPLDAA